VFVGKSWARLRANLYKMKLGYENFIKGKFFPVEKEKGIRISL
jgi:hypothetical protein